jgi:hypothetical protein
LDCWISVLCVFWTKKFIKIHFTTKFTKSIDFWIIDILKNVRNLNWIPIYFIALKKILIVLIEYHKIYSWDFCLIPSCIFSKSKLQRLSLLLFLFFNRIKSPDNPFKPQTQTRENWSLFYRRIEPYFLTIRFRLDNNFGPKFVQTRPLFTPNTYMANWQSILPSFFNDSLFSYFRFEWMIHIFFSCFFNCFFFLQL